MHCRWSGPVAALMLVLAGCGSGDGQGHGGGQGQAANRGPAGQASEAVAGGIAAAASSGRPSVPAAAAQALLDRHVSPRETGTYAPADECGRLPGAEDFRRTLAAAVLAGDADAVASLALPTVRLGFGGDDGRERLRQRLAAPDGKLMADLRALLQLGCAADAQGGMTMPWYFAQDLGDVDSYSAMLVTGVDVPLFGAPDAKSAVKRKLSWELVTLGGALQPDRTFQQVTTAAGDKGFVATEQLRSLVAERLLAERQGGQWRISAIVAGD